MCEVRVRILSGMKEFVGKVGTIVGREDAGMIMYRIELDQPVRIAGQGLVKDDLWSAPHFEVLEFEPDEDEAEDYDEPNDPDND